ncbi:MAG: hypothetical protein VX893_05920, partial [Candidatus Latescibacterota bacterium]|nr:hypothetical protein [Candidatus Latescibacterota bacterium]
IADREAEAEDIIDDFFFYYMREHRLVSCQSSVNQHKPRPPISPATINACDSGPAICLTRCRIKH